MKCHYMTDREEDMKNHVCNVHTEKVMSIIDSKLYIVENAWLDLTSWTMKDIERKYKTYHEADHKPLVWVIMDLLAENPRGTNNAFRAPVYYSSAWKKMVGLVVHTIKTMLQKDVSATSGEDSKAHKHHWISRKIN